MFINSREISPAHRLENATLYILFKMFLINKNDKFTDNKKAFS